MPFDKDEYRKNRAEGKRGQGETPAPPPAKRLVDEHGKWVGKKRTEADKKKATETDEPTGGSHMVQIGTSLQFVNRKKARSYAAGEKKEKPAPKTYTPGETNHQRVKRQREMRMKEEAK